MSSDAEAAWLSPQVLGLTALLLDSHRRLFNRPLLRSKGIRLAAQELFVLDQVVLCHDGSDDPRFLYANRAALLLFGRSWDEMVGLPSRLSAASCWSASAATRPCRTTAVSGWTAAGAAFDSAVPGSGTWWMPSVTTAVRPPVSATGGGNRNG